MTTIAKLIEARGGLTALANELETTKAVVYMWRERDNVPPEYCPRIEKLTDGKFRCEDLNSQVDWAYLRTAASAPQKQNRSHDTPEQLRETASAEMRVSDRKVTE